MSRSVGLRSRVALGATVFSLVLLYVPLLVLAFYSFRAGGAWTWEWYRKVLSNPAVMDALSVSLSVGFWATCGATVIGTALALAVQRVQFPGRGLLDVLAYLPVFMPEIVLGLALLVWFVVLGVTLGSVSVTLAHTTLCASYVFITVKARLADFDESLEEAARDLGADAWQTFRRVTFPILLPGIVSGALLAFTLSFDDFLLTFFTSGVGSDTLPVRIYSMIKFGISPEVNALSTLMVAATVVLVGAYYWGFQRKRV